MEAASTSNSVEPVSAISLRRFLEAVVAARLLADSANVNAQPSVGAMLKPISWSLLRKLSMERHARFR